MQNLTFTYKRWLHLILQTSIGIYRVVQAPALLIKTKLKSASAFSFHLFSPFQPHSIYPSTFLSLSLTLLLHLFFAQHSWRGWAACKDMPVLFAQILAKQRRRAKANEKDKTFKFVKPGSLCLWIWLCALHKQTRYDCNFCSMYHQQWDYWKILVRLIASAFMLMSSQVRSNVEIWSKLFSYSLLYGT